MTLAKINPHALALEAYQSVGTNADAAATYAFSLYLQHKPADALKVLEKMKPADLENPSIAGYYGLVLQATGNKSKARKYLDLTAKAKLLPEERTLMERARAGI